MKLLEQVDWLDQVPPGTPQYDFDRIVPPTEVELRYINIRHHTDGGIPDYITEVLAHTDVFMPELPGWIPDDIKQLNKMASGDYKAREKVLAKGLAMKSYDEGMYDYNTFVMKALYNSKVEVALVDYRQGFQHDEMFQRSKNPNKNVRFNSHKIREQFVMESLCAAIDKIRAKNDDVQPVRVAMTYGVMHMAMADGLKIAASQHDSDLAVTQEFEDSLNSIFVPGEVDNAEEVINYQTWLRAA